MSDLLWRSQSKAWMRDKRIHGLFRRSQNRQLMRGGRP